MRNKRRRTRRVSRWLTAAIAVLIAVALACAVRIAVYLVKSRENAATNAQLEAMYESAAQSASDEAASESDQSEPAGAARSVTLPASETFENAPEASGNTSEASADTPDAENTSEASANAPKASENTFEASPNAPDAPQTYQVIGDEICPQSKELYAINPDLVGWLKIPGVLSLPVVYRDNEYYLKHDFYGNDSDSGTLFLDVLHPLEAKTQYLFIHGHSMYDGSMFAMLTHYRKTDFIQAHPKLTLTTLYSLDTYEIAGVLCLSVDEMSSVAGLGRAAFSSEDSFEQFIAGLRGRAAHFTDEEIAPDAALLALSTCFDDGRIVVIFRRISSVPLT